MDYRPTRGADDMGTLLLTSPQLRDVLHRKAQGVLQEYRNRVKVDTGENRREAVITHQVGGFSRNDRQVAVITADSDHSAPREFGARQGTRVSVAEHALRNALQRAGTR